MNRIRPPRRQHAQRGVTLVVALIMLVALSLLAAWAVKSSTMNLNVVGNMQARQQALAVAQTAIERTISSAEFTQQPAVVASRSIPFDVDGDGVADYTAQLSPAPACYRLRPVKMAELDPESAADVPCLRSSSASNSGIDASTIPVGDSLCADSEWQLRAVTTDPVTGARVAINQGVAVRGLVTDANNGCP